MECLLAIYNFFLVSKLLSVRKEVIYFQSPPRKPSLLPIMAKLGARSSEGSEANLYYFKVIPNYIYAHTHICRLYIQNTMYKGIHTQNFLPTIMQTLVSLKAVPLTVVISRISHMHSYVHHLRRQHSLPHSAVTLQYRRPGEKVPCCCPWPSAPVQTTLHWFQPAEGQSFSPGLCTTVPWLSALMPCALSTPGHGVRKLIFQLCQFFTGAFLPKLLPRISLRSVGVRAKDREQGSGELKQNHLSKRQFRLCKNTPIPGSCRCVIPSRWKYSANSSPIKSFSPKGFLALSLQKGPWRICSVQSSGHTPVWNPKVHKM